MPAYAIEVRPFGAGRRRYTAEARYEGVRPRNAEAATIGELRQQLESQSGHGMPFETDRPSSARLYDYLLGGKNNFDVDRQIAEQTAARFPGMRSLALANKRFLAGAVRWAASQGIRQFIDLGAGFPPLQSGASSVWEPVHVAAGNARVLYVDHDPMVVAHLRALGTRDDPDADAIVGDLRDPDAIFAHPIARVMLDFNKPVGLIFGSVLHYLPIGQAIGITDEYAARLRPGSQVIYSIGRNFTAAQAAYNENGGPTVYGWDLPDIKRLFARHSRMLPPGLANVARWRPGWDDPALAGGNATVYGGIALRS